MARGFEKSPVYQPRGTNNGFCHEGWKSMKSAVGIFIYDGYDFYCPPTTHNSRRTIADSREMRVGAAGSRQKIFWFHYKVMCFKSYTRGGGRGLCMAARHCCPTLSAVFSAPTFPLLFAYSMQNAMKSAGIFRSAIS